MTARGSWGLWQSAWAQKLHAHPLPTLPSRLGQTHSVSPVQAQVLSLASGTSCVRYLSTAPLARTLLHETHIANGGRMVPFAGFSMPVQYADLSVSQSHSWTREKASLFDVGHMVQHKLSGPGATELLARITPTSLASLQPFHSTLSCLLKPDTGGIIDDTVITRLGPHFYYLVTNASRRERDIHFLESQIRELNNEQIFWERLDGWGLVALQGPSSAEILQRVLARSTQADLQKLYFGQCSEVQIRIGSNQISKPVLASRGGYTGEDGFEISIPPEETVAVAEAIMDAGGRDHLRWAGLGARDSLRLEAGMCLYGQDLDEDTTPIEAGLSWIIGKDRRETADFNGANVLTAQLTPQKKGGSGVSRRRVGLTVEGAPARQGAVIVGANNEVLGQVTSGSPSPSLGINIAMGYVKPGWQKLGTEIGVLVRGRRRNAIITKMPFVPSRYWRRPTESV